MRRLLHLAAEPSSVPTVRMVVHEAMSSLASDHVVEDVRLVTSEVTSNAVRHSRMPTGSHLDIVVDLTRGRIRVEVIDGGVGFKLPASLSLQAVEPGTEVGGYGLYLVDTLSDRWGTMTIPRFGVWFERDLDPD